MVKNKGGNFVSSPSSSCRVHSAIQTLAKDRGSRGSLPESIPPGATNGKENKKSGQPVTANRLFFVVVRPKRFELLAYRFVACCSIQLSYERMFEILRYPAVSVKQK